MFFNAVLCTETVLFLRLCFVKLFFNPSKDHISKCLVKQPKEATGRKPAGCKARFNLGNMVKIVFF